MSNVTNTETARSLELAQQIVAILGPEGDGVRQRALQAAAVLLGSSVPATALRHAAPEEMEEGPRPDLGAFFDRDERLKPSDNAQLCAAFHYAEYGASAFSLDELRAIAREAGVVLPDRVDKTLNQAANKGKKLFQSAGKGLFRPTAAAGMTFKDRWNVRPGKRVKDAERNELT